MLNTDPRRFAELGYCLFPAVLDPQETAALRQMLDDALATPLPHLVEAHRRDGSRLDRPGYVGEPHARDLRWLEICRHPRILDAVEAVHGTDVVTLWLAIDDADAENAAMQVIPGSHQGYKEMEMIPSGDNQTLSNTVAVKPEQEESAITLAMPAGSLSIHDSYILHGSAANQSDRRRAGYTIRYCSTDTARVDIDMHPVPIFLVRGEAGARGEGYIDLRPDIEPTLDILA
jgi:hypothetical protein